MGFFWGSGVCSCMGCSEYGWRTHLNLRVKVGSSLPLLNVGLDYPSSSRECGGRGPGGAPIRVVPARLGKKCRHQDCGQG